jgi:hypothetical protein
MPGDGSVFDQLQHSRPIDGSVSATVVADLLNIHRKGILEVGGDIQRIQERLDKMVPEMDAKLKEHRAGAGMVVEPLGSGAELDRLFLREDGSVRFKTERTTVDFDGMPVAVTQYGLLDSPSVTKEHEQLRLAYGGYALAYGRCKRQGLDPKTDLLVQRSFKRVLEAFGHLPGRVGVFCRAMIADSSLFKRVISNTSGSGGQLVSVPTTSNIIRPTDLERRIPGLVRMLPAPTPSFKQPIVSGRALARKRGATAADPARYAQSTFTTSDRTLSVVDMAISALLDPQWVVDAGPVVGDPMGLVMDWLAKGYADTLELAFLHGDTASTHQDTVATWTVGSYFTAGDLDGSDSPAKFWIGWRARAFDDSNNYAGGGTFDITDHFGALNLMGSLAGDAVAICGLATLYKSLLPLSQFLTLDVFGPSATILTGQLGSIAGKPVIISQFMNNDLASTGLFTGSGTTGSIVYVNAGRYDYYEMDSGEGADFNVLYPERGAQYVGLTRRGILAANCLSTEKPAAVVVNL